MLVCRRAVSDRHHDVLVYMTSPITQGPLVICDVIVDHRPQMGGCSHVDAMRGTKAEHELSIRWSVDPSLCCHLTLLGTWFGGWPPTVVYETAKP